jgi:hypothetical protein
LVTCLAYSSALKRQLLPDSITSPPMSILLFDVEIGVLHNVKTHVQIRCYRYLFKGPRALEPHCRIISDCVSRVLIISFTLFNCNVSPLYLSIYGSEVLYWTLTTFFSLVIFFYAVGRTPWMGDQPVARPIPTQTE